NPIASISFHPCTRDVSSTTRTFEMGRGESSSISLHRLALDEGAMPSHRIWPGSPSLMSSTRVTAPGLNVSTMMTRRASMGALPNETSTYSLPRVVSRVAHASRKSPCLGNTLGGPSNCSAAQPVAPYSLVTCCTVLAHVTFAGSGPASWKYMRLGTALL